MKKKWKRKVSKRKQVAKKKKLLMMKMAEFKETYLKNYGKKEKLSKGKLEEQDERNLNERYGILEINI